MPRKLKLVTFQILALSVFVLAACGPQRDQEQEIAVAVALTQTAAALAAPTQTPAPAATPVPPPATATAIQLHPTQMIPKQPTCRNTYGIQHANCDCWVRFSEYCSRTGEGPNRLRMNCRVVTIESPKV